VTVDISSCGYTVEDLQRELFDRYNIPGREIHVQYADPAADDRHTRSKVLRLLRRADAYRARGPLAAPLYRFPENPGFHAPSLPAARRLLLRPVGSCPGRRESNIRRDLLEFGRAADQIVPYPPGIPVLVPGQVITREIDPYLVGLLRSQSASSCTGSSMTGICPAAVLKPAEERGLRRIG